jgi:hypothetical protein
VKRPLSPEPCPPDPHAKRQAPVLLPTPCPPQPPSRPPSPAAQLGKCARDASLVLRRLGWHHFIKSLQHPSDLRDTLAQLPHPAAPFLHRLDKCGVPLLSSTPPWTPYQRTQAYRHGGHRSAQHHHRNFLYEDMLDMIHKRYWTVLPYSSVHYLPLLKLAPSGVVPQRTCRPRPIMDYSFSGLNQAMVPLAPTMAMQFGNTIHRLLQRIAYADPSLGPVYLAKFNLSDGFYRIRLTPTASLALAVLLPGPTDTDHLIGIPLSLPMGWTDSPPYFSAFTETAADLANMAIATADPHPPPHPLEAASQAHPVVKEATFHPAALHPLTPALLPTPLGYADIYVDDFIG